jgi:hypothetical protein
METDNIYDFTENIKHINELAETYVNQTAKKNLEDSVLQHKYVRFKIGEHITEYANSLFLASVSKNLPEYERFWIEESDRIKLSIENFYKELGQDIKKI